MLHHVGPLRPSSLPGRRLCVSTAPMDRMSKIGIEDVGGQVELEFLCSRFFPSFIGSRLWIEVFSEFKQLW